MEWIKPGYSKGQVDKAGQMLLDNSASDAELSSALGVLSNWRASHAFPLNTFQATLRNKAREVYGHAIIVQRLKRTPSIVAKMRRYPQMKLSRMQDIGGCRAVQISVAQVRRVQEAYHASRIKHTLVGEKDYISEPKESGYRSIHIVYRYRSSRNDTYNGLLIELQLRSRLQHAWATAVETAGAFLQHSLKSSEGPEGWLEFFAYTSSAFAMLENTPAVPGTPARPESLLSRIGELAESLDVERKLAAYRTALTIPTAGASSRAHYYLVELQPQQEKLRYWAYEQADLGKATAHYLNLEAALDPRSGDEVVLVAAESLRSLKRAYPNYFANSTLFLEYLRQVTSI